MEIAIANSVPTHGPCKNHAKGDGHARTMPTLASVKKLTGQWEGETTLPVHSLSIGTTLAIAMAMPTLGNGQHLTSSNDCARAGCTLFDHVTNYVTY